MTALNMKFLRELWKLKGQVTSIALVVAAGIMSIVTMRGAYDSLVAAQEQYYRESRFADVWVSLVRAPESVRSLLEDIPGVDTADTRVTFLATLDLDDSGMPAHGRFVSVPELGRPVLNNLTMLRGDYLTMGGTDQVIISENFADARGFVPGDKVTAIINGSARELEIIGIAISPEHAYAVPPGALYPEDDRYGIFWASRSVLGPAYNMDGAFNEAALSLTPDANIDAVIDTVDELLEPYGGLGAYPRADQPSHLILQSELDQNRITGVAIPMIFLSVAVFLLYLVLGRLISTQRGEIAVLKAFGYSDWEVGWHFLMFAVAAVFIGGVAGLIFGMQLGDSYINMYAQFFKLPNLSYRPSSALLIFALLSCVAGAFAGALAAVRKAVLLPPAEAMQPEIPARFKPGILERMGIGRLLGVNGQMVLRNFERKPVQAFLSSLGIAFAIAILVVGFFMFDSVNHMMDVQFRKIQREDISLVFNEIVSEGVRYDLAGIEGIARVETYRTMPARLRFGHRENEVAIQGLESAGRLRRIVTGKSEEVPVPASGLILSVRLAEKLGVTTGDTLIVEMLEGKRNTFDARVAGVLDDFFGLSAYMSKHALWALSQEQNVVSGAFLSVEETELDSIYQEFKKTPGISGVASPDSMLQAFNDQMAEGLYLSAIFLLGFASIISVGVIYNGARISLSERGRELASLRVMGFHRREVAVLLLGEQGFVTLLGIPLGCLFGLALTYLMTLGLKTDVYRLPFVADPRTYFYSSVLVVLMAVISGHVIRYKLDRLDIIQVLKTKE